MALITSDQFRIIIGVGQTGLSVARYLAGRGLVFAACDTRESGSAIDRFRDEFPEIELRTGALDADWLGRATELVLSPGVAKSNPAIQSAQSRGARLLGDIDLFAREINAPVVAITGSNGKTTVTTLVGQMAADAGVNVAVGGNIGVPVLDLIDTDVELYVLELSSFQLETCSELRPRVATVLNLSADHMDRYANMLEYHQAKHRIYRRAQVAVYNRDDSLSRPLVAKDVVQMSFGLGAPDLGHYGLLRSDKGAVLAKGAQALLNTDLLKIRGEHNIANALAALALGEAVRLPLDSMVQTLSQFAGLPHRCQWVREHRAVSWFNDSKGTNVGATLAAINGLSATQTGEAKLVLIAGGQSKGQSFAELKQPLASAARAVILIGEDAQQIGAQIEHPNTQYAANMDEAVRLAASAAVAGDLVLLSPACASFDMFSGYEARGERFVELVEALA